MSLTKEKLDEIIAKYNRGEPTGYTDEEYDALLEEYLKEHGESNRPFLRSKQSSAVNEIVGTLSKVYGVIKPMREGQKTYYNDFFLKNKLSKKSTILMQYKFDGCSIGFDFETETFNTRGDYDNGESVDVTDLFQSKLPQMYALSKTFNCGKLKSAKFEFIMPLRVYNELYKNDYKRPRDAVAAAMTKRDIETCKLCTLIPLRLYTEDGEILAPMNLGRLGSADDVTVIQNFIDGIAENGFTAELSIYNDIENKETYQLDGVVVSVRKDGVMIDLTDFDEDLECSIPYSEAINVITVNPDLEVAIKIINAVKKTKLLDIIYEYGNTGRITPVAILEPVMFDNVKVDHVTLSNIYNVISKQLRYNDTVSIMYNIVPYFVSSDNDGDGLIPTPTKCPVCGLALEISNEGKTAMCINPQCTGRQIGTITNYCKAIGTIGISESTVSKLISGGLLSSISDLYHLNKSDIAKLPTFGDKSAEAIINTIKKASINLSLPRFMGAFSIRMIGATTWKNILYTLKIDEHRLGDFLTMEPTILINEIINANIKDVSTYLKRNIIEGLKTQWNDIVEAFKYVTFEHFDVSEKSFKEIITLTGYHNKDFIRELIDAGYDVRNWSNSTTLLIIKDETYTDSKSVDNALKAGIPILTVEQARAQLLQ